MRDVAGIEAVEGEARVAEGDAARDGALAGPLLARLRRNLACALFDLGRGDEARGLFEDAARSLGGDLDVRPPRGPAILERYRSAIE